MTKQKCTKCNESKSLDEFPWKNKKLKRKHTVCKKCIVNYSKQHYLQNKNTYKRRAKESANRKVKIIQKYVWDYLFSHPCVDCGESNIVVLEFDHKDGTEKSGNISGLIHNGSLFNIKREIEKCEVRCANCHKKRTAKQQNWSILKYIKKYPCPSG